MALQFSLAIPPTLPVRNQVNLAVFFERLGFDTLWFPDHMLFPDLSQAPDVWTVMAAVAARTSRVRLGTGVSDPHRTHPAVLAQRLATLDQLSRGRVVLGLGSGEAMNLDPYGIAWDRKVARLREAVTVMRGLLDSDLPFSFSGDFYQLKEARLGIRPYRNRRIPILLAALGPLMQKFCGQVADGWFPVALPVEHFGEYFRPIEEAARAAGRDPSRLERVASAPMVLTRPDQPFDPRPFQELVRHYALTLVWPTALERMGIPYQPPEDVREANYITVNPCDPVSLERYERHQQWVPMELIQKFVTLGDLETLAGACRAFEQQGATTLSITNASLDPIGSTLTMVTKLFPRFSGRPAPPLAHLLAGVYPMAQKLGMVPRMPNPRQMRDGDLHVE